MDTKVLAVALVLLAISASARAQDAYAQCVYSQAGYVAGVKWFEQGTIKSTKTGDTFKISATKPALKTENITVGQKSCAGGKDTKHVAVITLKGGRYAKVLVIGAADIAATDGAITVTADSSVVADSREMFAVVQPPAATGTKPTTIVIYGTVFKPDAHLARP